MKLESETQERFTPDAGTYDPDENFFCGACGDLMNSRFGVDGPTGSIEAMAKRKHLHDVYECPNREEDWHQQVIALRREKRTTASTLIESLLDEEAQIVLDKRVATKKVSGWRHG
jgi:hypothetical protein